MSKCRKITHLNPTGPPRPQSPNTPTQALDFAKDLLVAKAEKMALQIPLFYNINPSQEQRGVVLNDKKNRATILLDSDLKIPEGARNVSLSLRKASAYFTFPNLDNDSVSLSHSTDSGVTWAPLTSVAYERGLYDVLATNDRLTTHLDEAAVLTSINLALGTAFASGVDMLSWSPDYATERVVLHQGFGAYLTAGATRRIRLQFTPTLATVLGFPGQMVLDAASLENIKGTSVASFNVVNNLCISTDLLNGTVASSIVHNTKPGVNILDVIPIDAKPGFQILYTAVIDTRIPIRIPDNLTKFDIGILDENLDDLVMTNNWSVYMTINYDLPPPEQQPSGSRAERGFRVNW